MTLLIDKKYYCNEDDIGKEINHYPRLDTVILVEKTIRNSKKSLTRTGLYLILKGRIMYSTINVILAYLADSGKIVFDKNKKIVWIHNPKALKLFREKQKKKLILK